MENLQVTITFSPAARAELQSVVGALPPALVLASPMHQAAQLAQARDQVAIHGLPEDQPLYVAGRALTLHPDGCRLLLVLALSHELN